MIHSNGPEGFHNTQEQSPKIIGEVFGRVRQKLEQRLERLTHPYHNKQHCQEVMQATEELLDNLNDPEIFSEKQKMFLVESALRHDDGHSGHTFRQEVADGDLSNEEYAVKLLKEDLEGQLDAKSLKFMEDAILATSVGQSDISKLPEGKDHLYRPYKPETDQQKLLAFADISGFRKGWEIWLAESLNFTEESHQNASDIEAWIAGEEGFVNFYATPMLQSIEHLIRPAYFEQLKGSLDITRQKLGSLKDKSNPERIEIENKLRAISKSDQ